MKANFMANGRRAFTLLEILFSLVILMLMVVLLHQFFDSASKTTIRSQKNMDAVSDAQSIIDRMALDFSGMPIRSDLDYGFAKAAGNDALAFYSSTIGLYPSGGGASLPREVSVLGYRIADDPVTGAPALERGARQLDWSAGGPAGETVRYTVMDANGLQNQKLVLGAGNSTLPSVESPGSSLSNYQIFSDQIFRLEICFVVKADPVLGTPVRLQADPPANISKLASIVVAIAVLDTRSRAIVQDYAKLIAALPDAEDGEDILSLWTTAVNAPDFAGKTGIPSAAAQSVRIYQRYFDLQ